MRSLEFQPALNQIQVRTYTPCRTGGGAYETDSSSQFVLPYQMTGAYQQIGSASVASGGMATVSWPGLIGATEYEWYVTVSDGASTTTGPVWSFTTADGPPLPRPCGEDPSLVVCYPLDEGGDATAADGGQLPANDSALQDGPAWVAGQVGGALRFNGTTQYGSTPDEASLDIADQITIAAWIKPEKTSGTPQDVVKKAVIDGTDGYELTLASTGSNWPQQGLRADQPGHFGRHLPRQLDHPLPHGRDLDACGDDVRRRNPATLHQRRGGRPCSRRPSRSRRIACR